MPALLLIISLIAVSCAPAQMQDSDSDTIYVYFGNIEAKAIDETAYTPTGTTSGGASEVKIGDVNSYYWSYKATKNDSLFSQGQTDGFVNCADETGLGDAKTFSKGKWLFELRAYASKDDRQAGTQYLFSGTNESIASNNKDTVLSSSTTISIPVTYSYIAGTGTASFNYTVTIDQDTLTGHKTYEITGVNAIIDSEKKVALTKGSNNVWSASETGLASGVKTIGIEVFVDSETNARASKTDLTTAIILHGLTTEITGAANVKLAGAQMTISFSSTLSGTTGQNPGQPTEEDLKYSQYSVGSTGPAGGYIFYDAGSVQTSYYMDGSTKKSYTWRFLEAAPADALTSTVIFGHYRTSSSDSNTTVQSDLDTSITNNDHTTYNGNAAVGQGRMNTSLLVNAMGTTAYSSSSGTDTTATYAAKLCDDYSVNGFDDWFLPSFEELRYMYENLYSKNLGSLSSTYWSSSECTATHAWLYNFSNVNAGSYFFRNLKIFVRAVRAF